MTNRIKRDQMHENFPQLAGTDVKWRIIRETILNVIVLSGFYCNYQSSPYSWKYKNKDLKVCLKNSEE